MRRPLLWRILVMGVCLICLQRAGVACSNHFNDSVSSSGPVLIGRIYILGDSETDTGIFFRMSKPLTRSGIPRPSLGYFAGRFSDGPVWPDYIDACTGLEVHNLAVGGATSCPTPSWSPLIPGLVEQRDRLVNLTYRVPAMSCCPTGGRASKKGNSTLGITEPVDCGGGLWGGGLPAGAPGNASAAALAVGLAPKGNGSYSSAGAGVGSAGRTKCHDGCSSNVTDCGSLIMIWSGGNDWQIAAGMDPTNPPPDQDVIDASVRAAECQVQLVWLPLLQLAAGRPIVVFTLPPLELMPIKIGTSFDVARISVNRHNDYLKRAATQLAEASPNNTILVYDVTHFVRQSYYSTHNYTGSAATPCLVLTGSLEASPMTQTVESVCSNPSDYWFWDTEGHFTTRAHYLIAQDLVRYLSERGYVFAP